MTQEYSNWLIKNIDKTNSQFNLRLSVETEQDIFNAAQCIYAYDTKKEFDCNWNFQNDSKNNFKNLCDINNAAKIDGKFVYFHDINYWLYIEKPYKLSHNTD